MWEDVFFSGWVGLARVLVVGVVSYVALVAMLRLSGKRTLSKLNAFDLVVTVALGSTLSSIVISKDVALAEGLAALALLIGLQFVVTWSAVRSKRIRRFVTSEPTVLLSKGSCVAGAMRRERVTAAEVLAAIRDGGGSAFTDARLVLLESDGSLTAILRS